MFSIEVWQEGRSWNVRRRFKEFLAFHEDLLEEDLLRVRTKHEEEEEVEVEYGSIRV